MTGLHLYAILGRDPGMLTFEGVDGSSVRVVRAGGLWALVSDRETNTVQDAVSAMQHNAVVDGVLEFAPILPARFGASLPENLLLERIAAMEPQLRAALEQIGDAREFAVRLEAGSPRPARPRTPQPQPSKLTGGRAYLEARRKAFIAEDARRAELEAVADDLEAALAPLVRGVTRTLNPDLYRASFLVPKPLLKSFPDAFAGAVARLQLSPAPTLHGPFAPYSFTTPGGAS